MGRTISTAGNYEVYTEIEMDDATIGEACASSGIAFGFVRNISDPAQNERSPPRSRTTGAVRYTTHMDFYTSYNGALAVWAMLA